MSTAATSITRYSEATIPTVHGQLTVVVYREVGRRKEEREHVALVAGPLTALAGGGAGRGGAGKGGAGGGGARPGPAAGGGGGGAGAGARSLRVLDWRIARLAEMRLP